MPLTKRKPISTLFQATDSYKLGRLEEHHSNLTASWETCIGIYDQAGNLVAFVGEDDLFDKNGNRFYLDE